MDQRIITTKKFLKQALLTLLKEKPLSKINIKLLCEKAEVNRATFYFHYKDINSLFDEMMEEFMSKISCFIFKLNSDSSPQERKNYFLELIDYVDKNSDLFLLLFENNNKIDYYSKQYKDLQNEIYEKINETYDKKTYSNYVTQYLYYAGGSMLHTWIINGKKESPDKLASIMYILLANGYTSFNQI